MPMEFQSLNALNMTLLLMLMGLVFAASMDPYIQKRHRFYILIVAALAFSLLIENQLPLVSSSREGIRLERIFHSFYSYSVRPIILVLFIRIVRTEEKQWPFWVLIGVNTAIYMTAFFSDVAFSFSENGHFLRGPLAYSCHVLSIFLLLWLIGSTIWQYRNVRKLEIIIPVLIAAVIIAAVIMDSAMNDNPPVTFLTASLICSCVFFYIWLHLQFVREHEQALLAEQRIRIMISQIQPHFLFNTLSTIQALCRTDPDRAFITVEKFGTYLRQNIASLDQSNLIPLEKELEHTRTYAEIEMIRFPTVHVEYEIEDSGFSVPALSIQPLVENAIRHGVRIRKEGIIFVITYRKAGEHVIVVRDNGIGFDVESIQKADETHIGIRNVRERVETLCAGTLTIDSRIDEGTTVTIRLPAYF